MLQRILLLAGVLWASGASAAPREKMAVLEIAIEGDAAPELGRNLEKSLVGGLVASGYEVLGRAETRRKLEPAPELISCVTTTCLERIGVVLGTRRFVRARIEVSGATYSIELTLLGADSTDGVIRRLEESCAICTITEANELISKLAAKFRAEPVASSPVEKTDDHALRTPATEGVFAHDQNWKWVSAAAGALTLAGGITLLALDSTCIESTADGSPCPLLYDTFAGGIALSAVSASLAAISVYLFLKDEHGPAVTVRPLTTGSTVSVIFHF